MPPLCAISPCCLTCPLPCLTYPPLCTVSLALSFHTLPLLLLRTHNFPPHPLAVFPAMLLSFIIIFCLTGYSGYNHVLILSCITVCILSYHLGKLLLGYTIQPLGQLHNNVFRLKTVYQKLWTWSWTWMWNTTTLIRLEEEIGMLLGLLQKLNNMPLTAMILKMAMSLSSCQICMRISQWVKIVSRHRFLFRKLPG